MLVETNGVAHFLDNIGVRKDSPLVILDYPSPPLETLLLRVNDLNMCSSKNVLLYEHAQLTHICFVYVIGDFNLVFVRKKIG